MPESNVTVEAKWAEASELNPDELMAGAKEADKKKDWKELLKANAKDKKKYDEI